MAESNATQVILTDDGLKIIKAQNTANNAAGDVDNLNDPNLMNVIEKQAAVSQYAGLTSQYNVILERAKDANISTTALTTAYTKLNNFMTPILSDTTKASNIDRSTYKSLIDAYNAALSNVQTALKDSFNADIDNMHSSVLVASQAASSAVIVASQAAETGDKASYAAAQAREAANQAQTAGDNATNVANKASQAASSAILAGSTAAVNADKAVKVANEAKTAGDNATNVANNASQAASKAILAGSTAAVNADKAVKVANEAKATGDNATNVANKASQAASSAILAGSTATASANKASADYQTLSAGVKDGSVVHITTETVIDKGVIGTAEIANAAITNAQIGKEAVGTAQIADLAVGTAQIGDGVITNAKIGKLAVGTAQIANAAITEAQIGSLAVGTAQIKDEAVNSSKIAKLAVGTAQIGDGAITNAKIGKLAVGTAQIGDGAITNAKIGKLAVGTAQIEEAAITDAQVGNVSANKLTAGTIDFNTITGKNINASNITTGKLDTNRLNVNKLSALSADLGDVRTGSLKGVEIVAKSFSTPNGSFTTDENGSVVASNLTIRGVTNLVYNASLLGANGAYIPGWSISNGGGCWVSNMHDGVPSIGFHANTGSGVWDIFAQTKLHPLNGDVYQPFSASVWFKEYGSDTSLQYQFTLAFFDSNGNRINGGFAGNTWNGIGSGQDWRYVTINNVTPPRNAVSVGLQYWAYNGNGNACFSSPMLTQTAQATGYQPDTGNIVHAGMIDGSTISASTINASTINGATINTPNLNLGANGTFTESYDYTQTPGQFFLPKKASGTVTFNHGVIQGRGTMQTNVNGAWGGMNDSIAFTSGLTNNIWTEYAPGYYKIDMYKQGSTTDVLQRTYADPTGYYYTTTTGENSYLGNVLQTPQVQTSGVLTQYIGPRAGDLRLQIGKNGSHSGLLVGSYAGNEAVLSDFIYDFTVSSSPNVYITSNGHLGRTTSASKYKYNIKNPDIEKTLGDRLLNVHLATWNDKHAVDSYAEQLNTGEDSEKSSIDKYYGLIAEQLRDAGLDMFINYGKNHEIEGIQYDRAWIPLLSVIRRLNNKVNEYELRLSKLEGVSK